MKAWPWYFFSPFQLPKILRASQGNTIGVNDHRNNQRSFPKKRKFENWDQFPFFLRIIFDPTASSGEGETKVGAPHPTRIFLATRASPEKKAKFFLDQRSQTVMSAFLPSEEDEGKGNGKGIPRSVTKQGVFLTISQKEYVEKSNWLFTFWIWRLRACHHYVFRMSVKHFLL